MEKKLNLTLGDKKKVLEISKALSNPARLDILELLFYESLSVDEISKKLNVPLTSVCSNIAVLENSGLIRSRLQSGKHGTMKLCSIVYENINLYLLSSLKESEKNQDIIDIPVGSYFSFNIKPTCGLVSYDGFIGKDDDPQTFLSQDRFKAQLLWFQQGYIEYLIPYKREKKIKELSFSLEICSEAPNYRNVWPSDITFIVNNIEIGTYKSPGDFGGRKGKLTPGWWPINSTQFGLLKTFVINESGSFVDFVSLSDVNIDRVSKNLNEGYISLKIMIKEDSKNIGGINIFGEKFGDYPQSIKAKITYR